MNRLCEVFGQDKFYINSQNTEIRKDRFMFMTTKIDLSTRKMPILRRGSQGEAVKNLQEFLTQIDYHPWVIDGYFSLDTEESVRIFQQKIGVPSDGVVGERTWRAITRLRKFLGL